MYYIYVQTRVCSGRSGSRAPDARLQTHVRSAEPGPGDPGRLSAAGHRPRGTSGAQGTQIWGTLKLPVGLRTVGGLKVRESRGLDWIWSTSMSMSRGEGGELREWSGRGRRVWGRKRGGGPLRLVSLGLGLIGLVGGGANCGWRRCDIGAPQRFSECRS